MMKKLVEINIGYEAIEYIRYILKGGKTLSSFILKSCDLNKGKVTTYLPEDVSDENIKEFEIGGKLDVNTESVRRRSGMLAYPIPNTDFHLANIIKLFIKTNETNICLLEDAMRKPSHAFITPVDDIMLTYGDEVYYIISIKDAKNNEKVTKTISVANSLWHFVCVMASLPNDCILFDESKEINVSSLELLVKRAEKIVVGAYDGEGYLIWTKSSSRKSE